MFFPIDKPVQTPVAPSPIFKPSTWPSEKPIASRQCRRTEAAPEFPSQTARHNALRGISDKKARGDYKELCSQSDRCVGISDRFVQKQLGDLKTRDDHRNCQQGSDERTEQHRDQVCPLDAGTVVAADRMANAYGRRHADAESDHGCHHGDLKRR